MESELIKKAKCGDTKAFGELYNIYKLDMFRFAVYYLGNKNDAEDAVQETVLKAFSSIHQLKKNSSFKSWLFKILYYTCNHYVTAQIKQRDFLPMEDLVYLSDFKADINLDKTLLQDALKCLSEEEKTIVLLSVVGGYSSVEIGKIIDTLPVTVRSKQSRALAKLRRELSKEELA